MRKPSVTGYGGKYDKFYEDEHGVTLVEWQPGDGTRYVLVATPIRSQIAAEALGCAVGDLLVSVSAHEGLIALTLSDGALHHYSYLAGKLAAFGVESEGRVGPLVALLNLVLGDEEYGREVWQQLQDRRGALRAV